jgi:hypothetical protein
MADYTRLIVIPRSGAIALSGEFGGRILNLNTAVTATITNDGVTYQAGFGSDLGRFAGVNGPLPFDPNAVGFSVSTPTPPVGGFYVGVDSNRGLLIGARIGPETHGASVDIGVSIIGSSRSFLDSDVYGVLPDGTIQHVNSFVGLLGGGYNASYRDDNGNWQTSYQPSVNPMGNLGPQWLPRCFGVGTPVLMAGGNEQRIEEIRTGDVVLAVDAEGRLVPGEVGRIYGNVTTEWLILRTTDGSREKIGELTVTPGHHFRRTDRSFARIDDILRDDGIILLADGTPLKVTAERVVYSAETAHLYEEAEKVAYVVEGGTALKPEVVRGWRTYNFEVKTHHTYSTARTQPMST